MLKIHDQCAFLRYGCHVIVVGGVQSPALQALTRAFTRHGGHVFGGKLRDQWVEVPKIEQRIFERLQVVDVLAIGEVKLVPQERVQQRFDCEEVGNASRSRRTCVSCRILADRLSGQCSTALCCAMTAVESSWWLCHKLCA